MQRSMNGGFSTLFSQSDQTTTLHSEERKQQLKVVLIGNAEDKNQFLADLNGTFATLPTNNYRATIGVDFKLVDYNHHAFLIWDISASERFLQFINNFLRDADAVIFIHPTQTQRDHANLTLTKNALVIEYNKEQMSFTDCFKQIQTHAQLKHATSDLDGQSTIQRRNY